MNEKENKLYSFLKLIVFFAVGFLVWKYALFGLDIFVQRYNINTLWSVVLSRFALLGYLFPFIAWFCFEPQAIYSFRLGDKQAIIKMPFIWHGINDNVLRVSVVFSLFCTAMAVVFFHINRLTVTVLFAGVAFAVVNSILEEFLWRGLILSRTIHLWGEKLGLILMSLAFGLYHYPLGFSVPVCLLFSLGGIYFGGITVRSKGLLFGTAMHISMNLFFVAIGIVPIK